VAGGRDARQACVRDFVGVAFGEAQWLKLGILTPQPGVARARPHRGSRTARRGPRRRPLLGRGDGVLFVVGMMRMVWMVVIATVLLVDTTSSTGPHAVLLSALGLVAVGALNRDRSGLGAPPDDPELVLMSGACVLDGRPCVGR
jgi:hypothetical protein